jgi:SAM-dependent methyltransferase
MTNYDVLAEYYDEIMGDRQEEINLIIKLIKQHNPGAKSVLELGSGTGSVLVGLADSFEVSGIEQSPNMLRLSQLKLPNSALLLGDMATFELKKSFDVIICVFDSINHLSDFSAWQEMFGRVKEHLNPGGIFIFDMITTGRIAKLGAMPYYTQSTPKFTATMDISAAGENSVEWTTTIEAPATDGAIDVFEDFATETAYAMLLVEGALKPHFTILDCFERFNPVASDESDRVYYVCS